ncbi:MAG TPA: M24 family metallopeptidase [Candidatus Acidoferrales bacterium]|jgi:Xaa-Pro aminopeptidase|nr:M24 family metallopeptidase [Candidatus Acidoferrales bacterium]
MEKVESNRAAALLQAQNNANELFQAVETQGLIRPNVTESQINQDIYDLAEKMFGTSTYWHKRIVRAGSNTLKPYDENPPDLTLAEDDILFLDLGPVFEAWEADFGRTFVLGADPLKLKLRDDIAKAFAQGKQYFHSHPEIKAHELYRYAQKMARDYGWEYGGPIAGHLIGQFPHERIPDDKISLYVHPDNPMKMRGQDAEGQQRHWILEIHFIDRAKKIGGFYEELLTIG